MQKLLSHTFFLSSLAIIIACSSTVLGCAADTAANASAEDEESVASEAAELRMRGTYLSNGADVTKEDGPESIRVIAKVGNAKAKVVDSSLATCTATKNTALSTATRTVFDLTLEYESDDGWNGCAFELKGTDYKANISVGFFIDT